MTETTEKERLLEAAAPLIELAVAEDIGPGDATSEATLGSRLRLLGRIVAKSPGVVAGLPVAEAVFHRIDPAVQFTAHVADGQEVRPGELVAEVRGRGRSLLAAERTALNFLQRLSGIATLTRRFVDAVARTSASIVDTRKTLPGYRLLDKYAVRMGGGVNHRLSLFDMVLIKDNHIEAVGGITAAVERARAKHPSLPIEVEVRSLEELREVLSISPAVDRVMLDNMSLEEMRRAVELTAGRVEVEASGNVTLERVGQIAATGVDLISVGALTHSAPALDLSMDVVSPQAAAPDLVGLVRDAKATLGRRLVILGHHYQRDEVIAWADFRGDSLQLARTAAGTDAEFIVFCGVHFMAETAAILAKPGQHVIIPDPTAGCYLADSATPEAVEAAWEHLNRVYGDAEAEVTPITYVNSSAALKAFCGRHGGVVCTSSNADKAIRWALQQRSRVFFFPDQHLGRNTAKQMGIPLEEMVLWDASGRDVPPQRPVGRDVPPQRPVGIDVPPQSPVGRDVPPGRLYERARVILWPGACNVHQRFRPEHVRAVCQRFPGIRVLVHPECPMEVVDLADDVGSTSVIIERVQKAPAGSRWAIGTESRLVQRLQDKHPEQLIVSLAAVPPFCRTMSQGTLENLSEVLRALMEGEITNEVSVADETARWARVALERMLQLG